MGRNLRQSYLLAKLETTKGVDALPLEATDGILTGPITYSEEVSQVERDRIRGYFGANEQLAGTRFARVSFDVELVGSGTAGNAPAWGKLLLACGFAEASLTAPARTEYTPVTNGIASLTLKHFHAADAATGQIVKRTLLGAVGTVEFRLNEGEIPTMQFEFVGLDGGSVDVPVGVPITSAFKVPAVVTDFNSGDVAFGGTYAAGAVTGGASYPSRGFSVNLSNALTQKAFLGGQSVDLTDRQAVGSVTLSLTPAQEIAFREAIKANDLTTFSFSHDTGPGRQLLFFGPSVQRANPQDDTFEDEALLSMDLRFVPTTAGNDELRLVCL